MLIEVINYNGIKSKDNKYNDYKDKINNKDNVNREDNSNTKPIIYNCKSGGITSTPPSVITKVDAPATKTTVNALLNQEKTNFIHQEKNKL